MSFYEKMFVTPEGAVKCYLWKINNNGEIVVENIPEDAPIVSSSRGMAVMGKLVDGYDFMENMNECLSAVKGCSLRMAQIPHISVYGVKNPSELVERLNSKGTNKAKTVWRAMPSELQDKIGISWDGKKGVYFLTKPKDDNK